MDKKVYRRGMAGQIWYNATEVLALALTYRSVPENIEYLKKVKYGSEKNNYMNIFYNKSLKDAKKPLFIYIHGGGWISGLMPMRNPYVVKWAKKGFFSSSINYTFAPQKVFPTQLREVFAAIDFLCDKAQEDNFDIDNIILSGESAGGYFITYVASCANDPEKLKKLGIDFKHCGKINIKAVVSHCGCYDIERLTDKSKPQSKFPDIKMMCSTFVGLPFKQLREHLKTNEGKLISPEFTAEFPPIFLIWGAMDYLRYEAFDLSAQLDKLNVTNKLYKADGFISPHAWSIVTIFKKARACLDESFEFVLPYLPECFEKDGKKWIFKVK